MGIPAIKYSSKQHNVQPKTGTHVNVEQDGFLSVGISRATVARLVETGGTNSTSALNIDQARSKLRATLKLTNLTLVYVYTVCLQVYTVQPMVLMKIVLIFWAGDTSKSIYSASLNSWLGALFV